MTDNRFVITLEDLEQLDDKPIIKMHFVYKGESEGHPFRGNQYSRGGVTLTAPLTDNEIDALDSYKGGAGWQEALWEGKGQGPEITTKLIKPIDSAIAKSVATEDMVVYRGMKFRDKTIKYPKTQWTPSRTIPGQIDPFKDSVGKTLKTAGFSSTTDTEKTATAFTKNVFEDKTTASKYVLKINVPKGSHILNLQEYGGNSVIQGVAHGEAEYLLPRNGSMKINSITPQPGGYSLVDVDWSE